MHLGHPNLSVFCLLSFLFLSLLLLPTAAAPGPAPLPACPGSASGPTPIRTAPSRPGARRRVWTSGPVGGSRGPAGCQGWESTPRGSGGCCCCCRPPQRYRNTLNDACLLNFTFSLRFSKQKEWNSRWLQGWDKSCIAFLEMKTCHRSLAWWILIFGFALEFWHRNIADKNTPQGGFYTEASAVEWCRVILDNLAFMCDCVCPSLTLLSRDLDVLGASAGIEQTVRPDQWVKITTHFYQAHSHLFTFLFSSLSFYWHIQCFMWIHKSLKYKKFLFCFWRLLKTLQHFK